MDIKSQTHGILQYLQDHPNTGITSKQAFEMFGATRLSAIIFELRRKGYQIDTIMDYGVNRYGHKTGYATYVLVQEEN